MIKNLLFSRTQFNLALMSFFLAAQNLEWLGPSKIAGYGWLVVFFLETFMFIIMMFTPHIISKLDK
jgi:hypothetical protein